MLYPPAMQIKEVLLRAMNKEYSWLRAAEILGITANLAGPEPRHPLDATPPRLPHRRGRASPPRLQRSGRRLV